LRRRSGIRRLATTEHAPVHATPTIRSIRRRRGLRPRPARRHL